MLQIIQRHLDEREIAMMCTAPQLGRFCLQHYSEDRMIAAGHYGAAPGPAAVIVARYIGGCGAGRCLMALQPNGDITPCVFMPIVIGNIRKDRIGRLWRQNEILWKLRNRNIL